MNHGVNTPLPLGNAVDSFEYFEYCWLMITFTPEKPDFDFVSRYLGSSLKGTPQTPTLTGADGSIMELPIQVAHILRLIAEDFAAGRAVTIVSHEAKLTTQEAADFLGVSRPTLIKLLDEFSVPYETVGRHRRINFTEAQRLAEAFKARRLENLNTMRQLSHGSAEYDESSTSNPLIRR
jgi:excisionase family DNA binding protein